MAEPAEVAAAYRAAFGADRGEATATFEPLLSSSVRLVGPFGSGSGVDAVLGALDGSVLPGLLAAATWDEPVMDGDTLSLRATVAPGMLVGGVLSTLSIRDGLVTEILQEMVAAPRPDPTPLKLTQSIRDAVNGALGDSLPMTLAYVDGHGVPH